MLCKSRQTYLHFWLPRKIARKNCPELAGKSPRIAWKIVENNPDITQRSLESWLEQPWNIQAQALCNHRKSHRIGQDKSWQSTWDFKIEPGDFQATLEVRAVLPIDISGTGRQLQALHMDKQVASTPGDSGCGHATRCPRPGILENDFSVLKFRSSIKFRYPSEFEAVFKTVLLYESRN